MIEFFWLIIKAILYFFGAIFILAFIVQLVKEVINKNSKNPNKGDPIGGRGKVPIGVDEIEVYGDQYRNNPLKALYSQSKGGVIDVTITPPNSYQKREGWPELPFVNINNHGASATTKDNWLGYVPYGYGCKIDMDSILRANKVADAKARIDKRGSDYELVLLVSGSLKVSVTHNEKHQKAVNKLKSLGAEHLGVKLELRDIQSGKNKGKKQYVVKYKGVDIGTVSVPKSTEIKNKIGEGGYTATLDLRYYTQNSRHYTTMHVNARQ